MCRHHTVILHPVLGYHDMPLSSTCKQISLEGLFPHSLHDFIMTLFACSRTTAVKGAS